MSSRAPLDPKRPWIGSERELFSQLNFRESYTDPSGLTPAIHFRRAWLVLVLICVAAFLAGRAFVQAAGRNELSLPLGALFLGLVAFATIGALCLHARRARDAGKPPLLALITLVPAMAALAGLVLGAGAGIRAYETADAVWRYDQDAAALSQSDPKAFAIAEKAIAARRAKAAADRAARRSSLNGFPGAGPGGQGRPGRGGVSSRRRGGEGDTLRPSELAIVARAMWGYGCTAWSLVSVGLALWSLLWLGRLRSVS